MNPSKQALSSAKGLEYISNLITQSSIREELYQRRYESSTGGANLESSLQARTGFRNSLRELYMRILKFQVKCVCYYSENGVLRLARDFVKWDDWDSLLQEIEDQEMSFQTITDACKDERYEEECRAQDRRHKENMKGVDSIGVDVLGLRKAIEAAQQDYQRKELLCWLSTIDASQNYNNARLKHKAHTGDWLVNGANFECWQKEPNSFLWLHGKGMIYLLDFLTKLMGIYSWSRKNGLEVRLYRTLPRCNL